MALVWLPPQDAAFAIRAKGEVTFVPLDGLLTLTASETTAGAGAPATVTATSVTHEAP